MPSNGYQDLDLSRNEIRVLKFLRARPSSPTLLRCTLANVSLDDFSQEYWRFFEDKEPVAPAEATKQWLEAGLPDTLSSIPQQQPVIASSRYAASSHDGVKIPEGVLPLCDASGEPTLIPILPRFTWGDFEAISYCWESDVRNKTVLIDGTSVQITENLYLALLRLQRLPEAQSGMGFWIDGLCINQANVVEKNHQVNLMKRIYSQALSTIVWLGPSEDGSDKAADAIQRGSYGPENPWHETGQISGSLWVSVLAIWARNYFKRMWIIQELALNTTLSVFICGNQEISRARMLGACRYALGYSAFIAQAMVTEKLPKLDQDQIWRVAYDISNLLEVSNTTALDVILDLARKSQVTDPRDKIYGLLGMLPDALAAAIEPDYTKLKSDVYIQFAVLLLSRCDRLDEILSWGASVGDLDLPSWVPDWTTAFVRFHMRCLRYRRAGGNQKPDWTLWYDAVQSTSIETVFSGVEFRTDGILVDSVVSAMQPLQHRLPYRVPLPSKSQTGFEMLGFGRYGNARELRAALSRVLILDHPGQKSTGDVTDVHWLNWDSIGTHDAWKHPFEIYDSWTIFDAFRHSNADFPIFGQPFKQMFPNLGTLPVGLSIMNTDTGIRLVGSKNPTVPNLTDHHMDNIGLCCIGLRGRKLVTTASGYLGLVPDDTRIEDILAVMPGCNFPVVLRRCSRGFKYIGECYVDGLMDGEAFEAVSRGTYQVEDRACMSATYDTYEVSQQTWQLF